MLKLGGKIIEIQSLGSINSKLLTVSTNASLPNVLKKEKAFLVISENIPIGFKHYIFIDKYKYLVKFMPSKSEYSIISDEFSYLDNLDIVRISSDKSFIRVLFRATARINSILITEQCNHYCLMCSQPPKVINDSWILEETFNLISLIPKNTSGLLFTGGEPTLLGQRFIDLLKFTKSHLPSTSIHILTNGRSFKNKKFVRDYAEINHNDMMVGIPLYSDDAAHHDYIVQSKGAFDETVSGILNLKRLNQKVEIRIVLHKQSIIRLKELCEFIGRNLLFVDQVVLMGLEMTGFTRANLDTLWIDPSEYKDQLSGAVEILDKYGINVSVYNHQLCLVNEDIIPFYKKSISDWKNEFANECLDCKKISECGGFFSSGIEHGYSRHIVPFK